jgi:5-(hydroxymethyl)furfural/furfural oxidase
VAAETAGIFCDDQGTFAATLAPLDDDALDQWILGNLADYVHVAGTCRMGPADHADAVVDPMGRVVGYEGLRVCDASIFPDLPRANTHVSTVVVAEELAARLVAHG